MSPCHPDVVQASVLAVCDDEHAYLGDERTYIPQILSPECRAFLYILYIPSAMHLCWTTLISVAFTVGHGIELAGGDPMTSEAESCSGHVIDRQLYTLTCARITRRSDVMAPALFRRVPVPDVDSNLELIAGDDDEGLTLTAKPWPPTSGLF
ncbi:hypothetical protein CONPUDRAFT_159298 [Coniophora puteana RWD-64-598 SS2]|uniref:Uncharacterized protein n=1 Tax=Coniophora puteana (strain RWD-64-598) TaxID=741705 RepID=A0A5M3M8A7_CONPW|nr:uncharacterized protein CONPUDRAFT_159298 [Coniophora puteana RWD-64-598 SS2]EIW75166.1 hypothetical protein CONPUDRAFT_159298 [Coniophora puteana RWD-64-598 SS2]